MGIGEYPCLNVIADLFKALLRYAKVEIDGVGCYQREHWCAALYPLPDFTEFLGNNPGEWRRQNVSCDDFFLLAHARVSRLLCSSCQLQSRSTSPKFRGRYGIVRDKSLRLGDQALGFAYGGAGFSRVGASA